MKQLGVLPGSDSIVLLFAVTFAKDFKHLTELLGAVFFNFHRIFGLLYDFVGQFIVYLQVFESGLLVEAEQ